MTFRYVMYLFVAVACFASCAKEKVEAPEFEVASSKTTLRAGDTATFTFQGNPDNLVFYSGEPGKNYQFRTRTTTTNDLQIEFRSLVQSGVIYKNLKLLVSNNFSGTADTNSVKAAIWTDISALANFSAGLDSVPSGVISLKNYVNSTKPSSPIYIAFKYEDYKKAQGQNRWVIRTFSANNVSADGVVTPLATMATGGWQAVDFKNTAAAWSITTAQLLIAGGSPTSDDNEDWVISKGFDPTYIKPDAGIALKNISTTLSQYRYAYTKPGTYKAVFEASAVHYNGEQSVSKEVTITVTP